MEIILTVNGPVDYIKHDGITYLRVDGDWLTGFMGGLRSVDLDDRVGLEKLYQENRRP